MSQAQAFSLLRDGIAAAKAGNKAQTRRLLRQVTDLDPHNELAWLWLAGVAESAADSLDCLGRVLAINPNNDRAREGFKATHLQAGVAAAKADRREEAVRHLSAVTDADPRHELAWYWRSSVADSPHQAVEFLERVLEINPGNDNARLGLRSAHFKAGVADAKAGRRESARKHLLAVTEADPKHEQAWQWLASVAESLHEGLACLQHVVELNPRNEKAKEGIRWHQAQLESVTPAWECPLCGAGASRPQPRCTACGAVLTLQDLDAVFNNPGLDPTAMAEIVQHYRAQADEHGDFDSHVCLALAHLNLRRWDDAAAAFQAALGARGDRVLRSQVNAFLARKLALSQSAEEQARLEREKQRTILVVDDSPTVRKLVQMTMEKQGYRVVSAADGYEAADCLRASAPDLVLLDIAMPGMDGYQVCKLIKEHPETARVPVIMLSGKDGFFDKIRGRLAGSTAYVTKPFEPDRLVRLAEKYCPCK